MVHIKKKKNKEAEIWKKKKLMHCFPPSPGLHEVLRMQHSLARSSVTASISCHHTLCFQLRGHIPPGLSSAQRSWWGPRPGEATPPVYILPLLPGMSHLPCRPLPPQFLLRFRKRLFKSLYWICYNIAPVLCFGGFWGVRGACRILAPWPGMEPAHPALEGEVLTSGPSGKSLRDSEYFRLPASPGCQADNPCYTEQLPL